MRRRLHLLAATWLLGFACAALGGGVRVKDIAIVSGVRDNQLAGYGLVAGLAGDGDKNPVQTLQTIANILQRFGLTIPAATLTAKNVAIVMVTADIPAFKKAGHAVGCECGLDGGCQKPAGRRPVANSVARRGWQGLCRCARRADPRSSIVRDEGGGGASVQKNHPTVGLISDGALVEREIPAQIISDHHLELILREADFTTSARLAMALNNKFTNSSLALDSTTVRVRVPDEFEGDPVDFISLLEAVEVDTDIPARIVINERTGTIVATSHIHISSCAVSHGNLTISITSTLNVSQPNPFSRTGETKVTQQTDTKVNEDKGAMIALPELPTVEKVAAALNSLGVTPRDMMSMFQAMKEAGALQAELIIR